MIIIVASGDLEWSEERKGPLVDSACMRDHFGGSEAYRTFLRAYVKTRTLPDDVMPCLADLEKETGDPGDR